MIFGGGRGVRTLDTDSRIHAFQRWASSPPATPPPPLPRAAQKRAQALRPAKDKSCRHDRAFSSRHRAAAPLTLYSANNLHKPVYLMEIDQFRNVRNCHG